MGNADYSISQLLQIHACSQCRSCVEACPAVGASGDGNLSALTRLEKLKRLLRERSQLFRRLFRRQAPSEGDLKPFGETVFRCTLCGNCQEVCPVGIGLKDLWISLRQDLVDSRGYPPKIDMIRENLLGSHNVFAEDNDERADWVEDMGEEPEDGLIKPAAKVVYFTGCVASYFPLAQKIPVALAEVFQASEVDFTLLGPEEWCCGFPLLGAGLMGLFEAFRDHNLQAVKKKKAEQVVFACPSCFQMWREHYPREVPIAHASQFLLALLREGRVPLKELPLKVTYHDPCDLGRGARVFDAPREVLRSIPGVTFVEMERNREACRCCGGGGNLEMIDADLSSRIAKEKIQDVLDTGAQAVVSACQQCVRTMTTYVRRNKVPLEVMDIAQLVRRALKR